MVEVARLRRTTLPINRGALAFFAKPKINIKTITELDVSIKRTWLSCVLGAQLKNPRQQTQADVFRQVDSCQENILPVARVFFEYARID